MQKIHHKRSTSAEETQNIGEEIIYSLATEPSLHEGAMVICLYGELGSGKTTFTQGIARALGYTNRLLSPTFLLVRTYDLPNLHRLYHVDLYHVSQVRELETVGLEEMLSTPGAFVIVEWPEKIVSLLPDKRIDIHFQTENEQTRIIEIQNNL